MPAKTQPQHCPQGPAYTVKIVCKKRGCKEVRWIKPQDAFQVTMCVEHTAERRRRHRSEKAKAKRLAAKNVQVSK